VSHLKEREEKVCLNCNAAIYGRFCHVCGQENLEPHESFWHLLTHFLFDLIHFDGKFFSTLKYLLFRPGFLAQEHARGRRADYLHPIRLYIFISAFFFLIIFTFYGQQHETKKDTYESKIAKLEKRNKTVDNILKSNKDSLYLRKIADSFIAVIDKDIANLKLDSFGKTSFISDNLDYRKIGDEDKVTTVNPSQGWMQTYFEKKSNQYSTKEEFNKKMEEAMVHSIPKVLFIALPFYALFLMLFYVRNKKYNYVNHLLFSIYLFSFTFILILFSTWTVSLFKLIKLDVTGWAVIIATALAIIYTYKGLRNYYQQSRTKTILKFLLLTGSCFIILIVVSILLFVYSIKTI
jgi:cation transport ATPase